MKKQLVIARLKLTSADHPMLSFLAVTVVAPLAMLLALATSTCLIITPISLFMGWL